ncbi:PREDICTED: laccase-12-like [Amphimedon queenslandica]|nr:PREDICTED: laccase-12-like [Amphimedon queenslandica]|eukprot:XP_019854010.1 PREDICTED: laccase-12-like [Amphimedon queenslandica]
MLLPQAIFFSLFFVRGIYSEIEVVPCNHNTPVCECMDPAKEACEFTLDIEMLQTFTRYLLDDDKDSRGTAGSVWHINNGEWEPVDYDPSIGRNTLCGSSIDSEESKRCTQPFGVDGYTFRSFIAVNGRIPGPTLIVTEGQLVKVNVINRLASESVSVHWHGMHQRNSNWMDGVEHVTQCGIPPGASFTYIFKAEQYGTHWYHSHSGAQRTDGLFGALIVKEKEQGNAQYTAFLNKLNDMNIPRNTYVDNPGEHTLTLLDWQKSSSLDLFTLIQSSIRYFNIDKASELQGNRAATGTSSTDGAFIGPVPYWSGLINGRGRNNNIEYINSILSDFKVTTGQTYRFRLIGAQSLYAYRFSIEDHKLTVIATDGQFIEPVTVDYIIIHSGERYDFLLKAKEATTIRQFMIRAVTLKFTATSTYLEEQSAEAILNYNSVTTPSSDYAGIAKRIQNVSQRCTDRCVALNCPFKEFPEAINIDCMHITDLKLLTDYPEDVPTIATDNSKRLFFNFGFEGTRRTSSINGRNLKLPSASLAQLEPNKLADIENNEYCMHPKNKEPNTNKCDRNNEVEVISPDCHCTHVVDAEADSSIELVLSATGSKEQRNNYAFAHPIHLHGHYFHVVEIAFGEYDDNGILIAGNDTIDCGNSYLCVRPRWKTNRDYSTRTGMARVSPKAPLKDTLLIPAGGYAVVYFKTDNPGWWFLHCHIEVHQLEGMGVIINERGTKTPPPDGMYKCGNFSLTIDEFNAWRNFK